MSDEGYTLIIAIQKPSGQEHESDVRIWRFTHESDLEKMFDLIIQTIVNKFEVERNDLRFQQ